MDNRLLAVIIFFATVNMIAFLIMFYDKYKSRNPIAERIPEGILFFMAVAFGSVGVYAGMIIFHHKTRKWYFLVGIPIVILQNCAFLYVIYKNFLLTT